MVNDEKVIYLQLGGLGGWNSGRQNDFIVIRFWRAGVEKNRYMKFDIVRHEKDGVKHINFLLTEEHIRKLVSVLVGDELFEEKD